MKSKPAYVLILFVVISLVISPLVLAQNKSDDAVPSVPKTNPIPSAIREIKTADKLVPKLPEPLPNVPGVNDRTLQSPIPEDTMKALETIENVKNINKAMDGLKVLESLDKIQHLGTIDITLTNSATYKTLTISVTALLNQDDLDANLILLDENVAILKDTLSAELATLTDKELGWEQESRNVLKEVRKKINAVAGKEFLFDLFYSDFTLVEK
ncbi:MAG: hypothetical protein JW938_05860 [Candidatus Omnitrophica bacterium]|nr:hypothetical protein [Candidatus Omnitrophota bacterium]